MFEPDFGRVLKFSEDGQRSREEFSLGHPFFTLAFLGGKKGNWGLGRSPAM
jgi:hypothetical protein